MPRTSAGIWRTRALAYAVALLIFAGHLAYGANNSPLALVFAAIWLAALAALVLTRLWAGAAIAAQPLALIAIPFALVLALAALQLTPWALGGPHPVWQWAPSAAPVGTIDPYGTRLEIVKLLALAATFLVGCALGADDDRFRVVMRAFLTVGLAFSAWALVDHAASPDTFFGVTRQTDPARLSAAFGSSNTAAALFGALTLLNIVDLARTYDGRRPGGSFHVSHLQRLAPHLARSLVALALALTCLVLTVSRAGIAATAAVGVALVGVMMLGGARRGSFSAPAIGAAAVIVGLLAGVAVVANADTLQQRFGFVHADTLVRGQIFAAHWAAFTAAPWGGYGLGAFARINTLIMGPANTAVLNTLGATHNVYIQWLEEAGLAAAMAMFSAIALIALQLARAARRRRRERSWLLGILGVLALFLIMGASDYALQTPSMAMFLSLLLGLGFASAQATQPTQAAVRGLARRDARNPTVERYYPRRKTAMLDNQAYSLAGKRVWVVGHKGMVGSAIVRRLQSEDCELLTVDRREVDLERQSDVEYWMQRNRPDAIFIAAAKVGGIVAIKHTYMWFLDHRDASARARSLQRT